MPLASPPFLYDVSSAHLFGPRTYHTRSNHDALSYSHVTWLYTTVGITQLPEHCKVTVLRLLLDALNLVFGLTHYTIYLVSGYRGGVVRSRPNFRKLSALCVLNLSRRA